MMGQMVNEALREELVVMRTEDRQVRQELVESGGLGGSYVPRMEAVHSKNAQRLNEMVNEYDWLDEQLVGEDGAEAAWFIVQHAMGFPDLQRKCLSLIKRSADDGNTSRWHAAYLEDRIAMLEGRPQRYGTQRLDDPQDGRIRPWKLEDSNRTDEWRAEVSLPPLRAIPEPGPELPSEQQAAIRQNQQWWENWLASQGWPLKAC